jgi:cysteine synthase A
MKVFELVGSTPLIYIESLSKLTGCKIFGKAEFMNPGGSVKDRAAKGIILDAEKRGVLKPGATIVEGTAGNTGIALATLAASRGYHCIISMPDNQSREKYEILETLGAEVRKVPAVPFANENHFYHQAKRIAAEIPNAYWADQFENLANGNFHYESTGREIWEQTGGKVDIFVSAVGTGGTISGVSRYLKEKNPNVKVVAADPAGSGIYSFLQTGKFASTGSSVTEGIGIMRLTANFKAARVDSGVQISDQEMIDVLYEVAHKDGLILGTSSGINLMAAYRLAQENAGSGKTITTILCDHGSRYSSRLLNQDWLKEKNLIPRAFTRAIA